MKYGLTLTKSIPLGFHLYAGIGVLTNCGS